MHNTQFRTAATTLVALAIATTVGLVGCSHHPTTSGSSSTGETSSSTATRALVDVSAVWQSEPLPNCPKPPIVFNGDAPQGIALPDKASVARILAGAKSPAAESWVRMKLGWVTQWLAQTRAGIIADPGAGAKEQANMFTEWVTHVREELQEGRDIASDLDGAFPEGCI